AQMVSVIMPTYKRPDLLPRAVRSVLEQTYRNLELIIVDDNSPDHTGGVVQSLMAEDNRIRYIRNETNLHAPGSRNVAIQQAQGEFVAFLDDDDEWMPQKLELQMKLVDRFSVVGCLYNKNQRPAKMPECHGEPPYGEKTIEQFHFQGAGFCPSAMLTRIAYFREVGGFDPQLTGPEGMDLFTRLVARFGTAAYIKLPLHIYYTEEAHGKPRVTTSKRLLDGALKEFEKNKHLRSPAAQKLRRCNIELMRSALAEKKLDKIRYFLKSLRFVDPFRPLNYWKVYVGRIFIRWPGIRRLAALYRQVKYR
ncbi:MAG: glycosyltransferase, partial [Pirellulales bacterium]|nr:glycosyltransferase [Pirellulales bacterium]